MHLGWTEAWSGTFLPMELEPTQITLSGSETPLGTASSVHPDAELREYADRLRLPTDSAELQSLFEEYMNDGEKTDADYHIQVHTRLMQAVTQSLLRKQPLWVVR